MRRIGSTSAEVESAPNPDLEIVIAREPKQSPLHNKITMHLLPPLARRAMTGWEKGPAF